MDTPEYNLLEEAWIPVLYHNGNWERVGILKAIRDADKIRQIATSNPMDRIAILRFLVAIVYWANRNSSGQLENFSEGIYVARCEQYLEEHRDSFDLLGENERFYQDRHASRSRTATDLLQEIPTGNNFWHFRHSTDIQDGLCLSCCAFGLLRLPLFSVSGLPNLKAGINGVPPIYVVPIGSSLHETFLLNWVLDSPLGNPSWVKTTENLDMDEPIPLLVGLTMLSRRVWLHAPVETTDTCISCGEATGKLVRTCEFQTAGEQRSELWRDPHVIYSTTTPRKSRKAENLTATGTFRMDRPWPYLLNSLIDSDLLSTPKPNCTLLMVGFATDNAKNVDVWERQVTLGAQVKPGDGASEHILRWHKEGSRLEKRVGRSIESGRSSIASIRPHIEELVSSGAEKLIIADLEAWSELANMYRPLIGTVARALHPGYGIISTRRRREAARCTPFMAPPSKTEKKKTGRKKP